MTELSHSDAQIHEMKDFEYLYRQRESQLVPVILHTQLSLCELFSNCEFFILNWLSLIGHYLQTNSRTELGLHLNCRVWIDIQTITIPYHLYYTIYFELGYWFYKQYHNIYFELEYWFYKQYLKLTIPLFSPLLRWFLPLRHFASWRRATCSRSWR